MKSLKEQAGSHRLTIRLVENGWIVNVNQSSQFEPEAFVYTNPKDLASEINKWASEQFDKNVSKE